MDFETLRGWHKGHRVSLVVVACLALSPVCARAAAIQESPAKAKAGSTTSKPTSAAARAAEFDRLLEAATEARKAQHWDEAADLYGKAVRLKPSYVEGHWYRGTAYYSLDDYANGRE